jgi:hypothetical protein
MTAAAWTIGAIAILAAGLWPLRSMLRSNLRRPHLRDRDEARSLLSQLSTAVELAANDLPAETRASVERYQLLAGAALGGSPDQDDYRRSIELSRTGLALLSGS